MAGTVLITGATGHVGAGVLIKALQDGYPVRAAVRNLNKAEAIRAIPPIRDHNLAEKLSFVEVPDIIATHAYNEAVQEVDYIIHVASPVAHLSYADQDLHETLVRPALQGTMNLLNAALASPSVKRVVITSSIGSNSAGTPDEKKTPDSREPAPTDLKDLLQGYRAAKHSALLATDAFVEDKRPHFDVINVMPAFVVGPKWLAKTIPEALDSSNGLAAAVLFQPPVPVPAKAPDGIPEDSPVELAIGAYCDLEDTALVHVESLKLPAGPQLRNFGLVVNGDPNDAYTIAKKHFPKAFEWGLFKEPQGKQDFYHLQYDTSNTEKVFGIKFKSFKEMLVPALQQVVDMVGKT